MIELAGIRKLYSGRCVIDAPALRFEQNRKYAVLGANGSGKSTLLKIMAGITEPTEGSVKTDLTDKKSMGYMPQKSYGFSFSALKNVMMAIDDCPERMEMAKTAVSMVGMSALINADASKLSGGETQRIAFARIISLRRKLLLLDEPTASMDLKGIDLVEDALLQYCARNECTVIFATHSPAQAMRLADEVIFLHNGTIAEHGETVHILNEPQSEEARSFLNHWRL
jgi:tungstate transport system ATP-binding protein